MPVSALPRRAFLGLATASLACPARAFGALPTDAIAGHAFGTRWRVVLPGGADSATLRARITSLLAEIDARQSPWRRDSEIGRFNRARHALRLSPETATVVRAALHVADQSAGAFDPTVGPLVARWGFGPIAGKAGPGPHGLALDGATLVKDTATLTLDPCGIAKGRALDRIASLLHAAGVARFLADLGGEVLCHGYHPDGRPWRVGIEDPRPGVTGLIGQIALRDGAVATSGIRAQAYEVDGQSYTHIIDPARSAPLAGPLLSVSIRAAEAMMADAWATACLAAGAERGPRLARDNGLDALFVMRAPGGLHRVRTGRFDERTL